MDTYTARIAKKISAAIGYSVLTIALLFCPTAKAAPQLSLSSTAVASFVGADAVSQGNWQGKYGADGYSIANSSQALPSYASFATLNQSNWTWTGNTTDPRALQTIPAGRIAATWYSSSTFSLDVNLTDGKSHPIAIYALDWDAYMGGRAETIQVVDANSNAVLDTRNISSFTGGIYLVWNVTGHVRINATMNAGGNSVVSGIFFGGAASSAPAAVSSFVGLDSATQGNWQGKYGADGYSIANGSQALPSYASFATLNQSNWTWTGNTTDPRALQTIPAGRIAATWYSSSTFSLDVNLTDGKSHPIAIYALDWDAYMGGRAETIQVVDANSNAVLDTRNISSFTGGIYLVWNVTGHVRINATMNAGGNSVVSGIFFGGAASIPPVAGQIAPTITTQPISQAVAVGQSATFLVGDAGTAPLTYQWKKNGVAISGATSSNYTTLGTASSDNGSQFSVVVTNGAGAVASSSAVLTVNTPTLILNTSATSLSFGSVNLSSSSVQTVTLTNVGTGNVVISSVSISGAGFNASGVSSGTILAPGQSAMLSATFTPAASGSVTGAVSVASNATSGAKVIALSGAGAASIAHSVTLSWSPSTSTVVGYNVYVSTVSGSSYTKLSGNPAVTPSYVDTGLETAQTRYYVVTSVDSNSNESGFSNQVAAIVP